MICNLYFFTWNFTPRHNITLQKSFEKLNISCLSSFWYNFIIWNVETCILNEAYECSVIISIIIYIKKNVCYKNSLLFCSIHWTQHFSNWSSYLGKAKYTMKFIFFCLWKFWIYFKIFISIMCVHLILSWYVFFINRCRFIKLLLDTFMFIINILLANMYWRRTEQNAI